jgi:tetratricopeptide (TPR) repeat protein
VRSVEGAQERAKDLLSEALRKFKAQGKHAKVSEAQYELGICYWRLGANDEARLIMQEASKQLTDADVELRAKILIRCTLVEISENRYSDALNVLKEAESVFESAGDALKGRWHGQKGLILRRLATAERRADYADRAIIEFTAAIYHYEQARHERYCALNLNNLAMLLYKLGRYGEAHEHLDRAQLIFTKLKDPGNLAQVDETRVRVLVAERKYREAERIIIDVTKTFEKGGEAALLADALTVQGVIWARLGVAESSIAILHRAMRIAQHSRRRSSRPGRSATSSTTTRCASSALARGSGLGTGACEVARGDPAAGAAGGKAERAHDAEKGISVRARGVRRFGPRSARGAGRRAYAGTYDFGLYPLYVKDEGGRLRFHMGPGRPAYTLLHQGGHAFVAGEDPDAIRLTFTMRGGRADKLLLRMGSMHWYAERVG